MKIALIAPLEESIPPKYYGGIEWVVYYLAHLLGKKGHQVDLYATGDSRKEHYYSLISIVGKGLRSTPPFIHDRQQREAAKWLGIAKILELLSHKKYDVIHNHASWRMLNFGNLIHPQMITTHHGPLSPSYQKNTFLTYKDFPHISISYNQRKDLPELNYVGNIYNGTDIHEYPFSENVNSQSSYIAFLARMSPEKGGIDAALAAERSKKVLHVAAKVDEVDKGYFDSFKSHIDKKTVIFEQEINQLSKLKHLQAARCLLAPIKWEEPFGLMFTEAMACGTPVIAYSRGSAPEIIKDGVTGFLINESEQCLRGDFIIKKTGIDGLVEAIKQIYSMSDEKYSDMRKNCRAHVEKNFTIERMVDQYEALYKEILAKNTTR
jgi:glycosyltransferase involved in cell wall biosynthesis